MKEQIRIWEDLFNVGSPNRLRGALADEKDGRPTCQYSNSYLD